jgi:murein DD-endopeptidase MepM/ murein hydrolase activator NlpD
MSPAESVLGGFAAVVVRAGGEPRVGTGAWLRRATWRASVLATIFLLLLAPVAISSSRPERKLDATRERLQQLRHRLEDAQGRAAAIKARIRSLGRAITEAEIVMRSLDVEIARIRSELRTAEARRDLALEAIAKIKEAAMRQAVELYKSGSAHTLATVLDARSVTELNDRIELLGVAANENSGALVRYGRLRLEIEAHNRTLFEKEAELARSRRRHAHALARRTALRRALTRNLAALSRRIHRDRVHEGNLEAAAAALRKKIVAAQASAASRRLGTSAQGMIWPLAGPVTSPFGPRWGGVHLGIDIDGYTGQPVVAAKDGRSIYVGAGMSGYGNAVVVDHGGGVATLYAHLSGYEVSSGSYVDQGEVVGYVGCTGNCYGDHLHFEVRVSGQPVNPLDYLP